MFVLSKLVWMAAQPLSLVFLLGGAATASSPPTSAALIRFSFMWSLSV